MMPGPVSKRVVADRLAWIEKMVAAIRELPLDDKESFFSDSRNVATVESRLRRALEALFDLGRHLLAKGFGSGITEYKEIALALKAQGVLANDEAELMRVLAGYRNRLVHFYHEVNGDELYDIGRAHLSDLESLAQAIRNWLNAHADKLDESL